MTNRFDLEQSIMKTWNIIEDVQLLRKLTINGLSHSEIYKYLEGLETIYNIKFEELFGIFESMIANREV